MENIIISDPERLKNLKMAISKDGAEKLHLLSDFDRTLTTAFVDGKGVHSLISILYNENYLSPDYRKKAQALYQKYYPIEIDPKIAREKKKKKMIEWWTKHFALLIKSGLNKNDLKDIIDSGRVRLRQGCAELIDFLKSRNIPLVIMSASGVGIDPISMFLEKEGKLYDNIHIISNYYEWDENGNAIGVKEPIIHSLNKDETAIQNFPAFKEVKNRKNVILLGDILEDIEMVEGFDYDNLIKIGFLNEKTEENLEGYKRKYDVVILNDSSMDYVNQLLKEIIK